MTANEMINVIRAAERGEPIEFCPKDCPEIWKPSTSAEKLEFDFHCSDYRISPIPTIEKRMNAVFADYCKLYKTEQWAGWPGSCSFARIALNVVKEFEK